MIARPAQFLALSSAQTLPGHKIRLVEFRRTGLVHRPLHLCIISSARAFALDVTQSSTLVGVLLASCLQGETGFLPVYWSDEPLGEILVTT